MTSRPLPWPLTQLLQALPVPRSERRAADSAPLLRLIVAVLVALSALGTAGALLASH